MNDLYATRVCHPSPDPAHHRFSRRCGLLLLTSPVAWFLWAQKPCIRYVAQPPTPPTGRDTAMRLLSVHSSNLFRRSHRARVGTARYYRDCIGHLAVSAVAVSAAVCGVSRWWRRSCCWRFISLATPVSSAVLLRRDDGPLAGRSSSSPPAAPRRRCWLLDAAARRVPPPWAAVSERWSCRAAQQPRQR